MFWYGFIAVAISDSVLDITFVILSGTISCVAAEYEAKADDIPKLCDVNKLLHD